MRDLMFDTAASSPPAIDKFLALRPVEARKRLIERMKTWKFSKDEIPEERSFRECFKRLKSDQDRTVGTLQEA